MIARRDFIKKTTTASLALLLPIRLNRNESHNNIGIQLYSIRQKLNEDFEGSMRKLSKIGFNAVETANYKDRKFYGYTPKEFFSFTTSLNIKALSSHANVQMETLAQTIEDTLEAGMQYLVKPSFDKAYRNSLDDYKKQAEVFNKVGEKCKQSGLRFGYHNHAFEFEKMDGQIPYDVLLKNTEADLVCMQLDTYWMVYAGYDPMDYINNYPHRFELLHIKDLLPNEAKESTEIGQGIIDFKEIFRAKDRSGMQYFFLEQESFQMDMFESIGISYKYLNTLL